MKKSVKEVKDGRGRGRGDRTEEEAAEVSDGRTRRGRGGGEGGRRSGTRGGGREGEIHKKGKKKKNNLEKGKGMTRNGQVRLDNGGQKKRKM